MISKVQEHFIGGGGLQDLGEGSRRLSLQDGEVVFWGNVGTLVVDNTSSVDIISVWLVENLSWERILSVLGNIVVSEVDNVLWSISVLDSDLVGVA